MSYKELVYRLRSYRPTYGWPEEYATVVTPTLGTQAADALEAQEKRIAELEAAAGIEQLEARTPDTAIIMAYARGREAGLEEAAGVVDAMSPQPKAPMDILLRQWNKRAAAAIRQLKERT